MVWPFPRWSRRHHLLNLHQLGLIGLMDTSSQYELLRKYIRYFLNSRVPKLKDFKYLTLTHELAVGKIEQQHGHKLHIIEDSTLWSTWARFAIATSGIRDLLGVTRIPIQMPISGDDLLCIFITNARPTLVWLFTSCKLNRLWATKLSFIAHVAWRACWGYSLESMTPAFRWRVALPSNHAAIGGVYRLRVLLISWHSVGTALLCAKHCLFNFPLYLRRTRI